MQSRHSYTVYIPPLFSKCIAQDTVLRGRGKVRSKMSDSLARNNAQSSKVKSKAPVKLFYNEIKWKLEMEKGKHWQLEEIPTVICKSQKNLQL